MPVFNLRPLYNCLTSTIFIYRYHPLQYVGLLRNKYEAVMEHIVDWKLHKSHLHYKSYMCKQMASFIFEVLYKVAL